MHREHQLGSVEPGRVLRGGRRRAAGGGGGEGGGLETGAAGDGLGLETGVTVVVGGR